MRFRSLLSSILYFLRLSTRTAFIICLFFTSANAGEKLEFHCQIPPQLNPNLPVEVLPIMDQDNVNCFAWQEFIALNWPESRSPFGDPKDENPTVWMNYKDINQIFRPDAVPPEPWESANNLPEDCRDIPNIKGNIPILENIHQAGVHTPSWLTGQNGKNVYYEVKVNRDEFEYILQNQFYNAQKQYAAMQDDGSGINLPTGKSAYGNDGAIEVKAAWLEIDDPLLWPRYKMTMAVIHDSDMTPRCRLAPMGLVALHIIHKTPVAQQWTWATFEHTDNAPDRIDIEKNQNHQNYLFYKKDCSPSTSSSCWTNRKPECKIHSCDPKNQPIQVVRETALPHEVSTLNENMSRMIAQKNSDSVWQHYQLINVMWPGSSQTNTARQKIPLPQGGAQPTILANTILETYVQSGIHQKNCLDCHQSATIAPTRKNQKPKWASDYSFVFSKAYEPDAKNGDMKR